LGVESSSTSVGAGGTAGAAIVGYSNISWNVTGTVTGPTSG
jgi:hypothetical protein